MSTLRIYVAEGPTLDVEGEYLGLKYINDVPVIGILVAREVEVRGEKSNYKYKPGDTLYCDVLSHYVETTVAGERVLWTPRDHFNTLMPHQKEYLAGRPEWPDRAALHGDRNEGVPLKIFRGVGEITDDEESQEEEGQTDAEENDPSG